MRGLLVSIGVGALALAACGGGGGGSAGADARGSGGADAASPDASPVPAGDPFAPQPDTSEGLTNVSADLDALLEHGALATACADYAKSPNDRHLRLLCGKAMFFDEGFGTGGVPKPLVTWLIGNFPDQIGPGFTKLGMIEDPRSSEHLPLGLAPGAKLGSVDTLSFTCASCHFGRLPDGRYAVGAPNHAFAYGAMNLDVAVLPMLSIPGAKDSDHDPDALAVIQPLRDRMNADPQIGQALLAALLPLIGSGGANIPTLTKDDEHAYAHWRTGTMDFFIKPLPFDDQVMTVSKISALWGLPDLAERQAHGFSSSMLGWTGSTISERNFLAAFVQLGGGTLADWPDDKLGPLQDYLYSLRAPAPATAPPDDQVAAGRAVYVDHCQSCHGGPRGMGDHAFTYEEIGTDDAMKWWADGPDHDGQPCCGLTFQPGDMLTHGIKSPRLVGLWAMTRFLHDGALDSLEQLLCLDARPGITTPAYSDRGHRFGCELATADRQALLAYLRAH
jgi:mono/diheme cytochrome c family protein